MFLVRENMCQIDVNYEKDKKNTKIAFLLWKKANNYRNKQVNYPLTAA